MTYHEIKSHKKAEFYPLSTEHIFEKITEVLKLIPPTFLELSLNVLFC